jgi:tetratricopeptide (TPR) repeat protein
MTHAISRFAVASLLMCLSHGVADAQDVGTPWDTCLKAPVRACILDEALALALSINGKGQRARLLRDITEAWAKGGDLYQASRVALLIPDGPPMSVLLAIAEAQAKAGRRKDAGETIERVLDRAYPLKDRLERAQWLHAISKAQTQTGATTEAAVTFDQALQSAQSFRIEGRPKAFIAHSLDGLLKALATEQADAGQIMEALQIAHSMKYDLKARAEALRAISAVQTKAGSTREAAATLDEALGVVRQAQSSPELWAGRYDWDWRIFIEMLCDIAKMQARSGMMEKAAATFDEALQVVPTIQDSVAGKRDWATAVALTDIAESQREAGLTSAALATLDRAVEAAGAAKQDYKREYWFGGLAGRSALAKAGVAQARAGLAAAAATTIDLAIERARALGQGSVQAVALSDIARSIVAIGLRAEADRIFDEALRLARTIADGAECGNALREIAETQLTAGLLDRAEATFGEAMSCFLSSQNGNGRKPNMGRLLLGDMTTCFIVASPALRPQIVQIVQSLHAGGGRASTLAYIANLLPN